MSRLDSVARGLLRPINPYATILLGLLTSVWGLWILLPWDVFGSARLFSKMDMFAPEEAWGAWAFLCGLLIASAVFRGFYKPLAWSMAFAVWHWSTVSIMMWWGDWQNTGGITYSFLAIYSIYIYLNIKVNVVNFGEDIPSFSNGTEK